MSAPRESSDWSSGVTEVDDPALSEVNRLWTIVQAFSNAAHTINNALQIAGGRAELIEMRQSIDPDVRARVRAIRDQTERVAAVVDELLTYSRGDAWQSGPVDLVSTVRTGLEMRSHPLSRARVAADLDAAGLVLVEANRRALLQLVLNLLVVAERCLAGRDQARVRLTVDVEAGTPRLDVRCSVAGEAALPAGMSGLSDAHRRVILHLTALLGGAVEGLESGETGTHVRVRLRPSVPPG